MTKSTKESAHIRIKSTTKERLDSIPLGKLTYDELINIALDELEKNTGVKK